MKRRVLVVLAADAVEQPNWLLVPKSTDVVELVAVLMKPELRGEAGPAVGDASEYVLFDWSGRRLPPDLLILFHREEIEAGPDLRLRNNRAGDQDRDEAHDNSVSHVRGHCCYLSMKCDWKSCSIASHGERKGAIGPPLNRAGEIPDTGGRLDPMGVISLPRKVVQSGGTPLSSRANQLRARDPRRLLEQRRERRHIGLAEHVVEVAAPRPVKLRRVRRHRSPA